MSGTATSTLTRPMAAIDIGSNSFRLEIGQIVGGRYKRLDYVKETVRLGGGLDAEGLLREDAAQRGLETLRRFADHLKGIAPDHIRAVATQTLREARNRDAFLQRGEAALGHPIEVISGREEARLIYAGVAQLQPSTKSRLVIDIGGRSTELILGRGRRPQVAESFQVGSVALSMQYFADGRFTPEAFRAAQVAAGAELEEALAMFPPHRWQEALGASGTVGAVSQVLAATGVTDGRLTAPALAWLIERCIEAGRSDTLQLPGLRDDRRPVIGGGLAILYTLLVNFGIKALLPAKGALRQGVIVELHERLAATRAARGRDVRQDSVRELQRRFSIDVEQAKRVRAVALTHYTGLVEDGETARELGWAGELHEAGMIVSHHDHHRHSAYLVSHADAPGFSQNQLRRLGDLLLGQRGGLRKLGMRLDEDSFLWQLLCLRLAVIQCHARADVDRHALAIERDKRRVRLHFARRWAEAHPRTLHLLTQEADAWARCEALEIVVPQ